jgi:hypothetical protein
MARKTAPPAAPKRRGPKPRTEVPTPATLPPKPRWVLARNLKTLLQRKGYDANVASAAQLGTTYYQLYRWTTGVEQPKPATLHRLLAALGATERELLEAIPPDVT